MIAARYPSDFSTSSSAASAVNLRHTKVQMKRPIAAMRMAACGAKRTSLDFRVKITAARPGIDDPIIVERQRRANHLCRLAITTLIVQPFLQKYSDFPKAKSVVYRPRPVPKEGRCATSSTREGMRWTRSHSKDERCSPRTAKPCGPDA